MEKKDIPIILLAGGRGTRLMEMTREIPKPMVTVGGKPILLHLMQYYSSYGFWKFIVCLGYKGDVIKDYFLNVQGRISDVRIRGGKVEFGEGIASEWDITLAETGENSLTGLRVKRAGEYVDAGMFGLTYGDGLSDVDLDGELAFHRAHGKIGTMTAVHPPSRFGMMDLAEGGKVRSFREKEKLQNDYINGGFFFFRREMLDRLTGENVSFESAPLADLAADGELYAWKHEGFWGCMDTMRDRENLESIFESGNAPWLRD